MKKKSCTALAVILAGVLFFSGCSKKEAPPEYQKYQAQFFHSFDTIIQIIGYTRTESEFTAYAKAAEEEFLRLNNMYDRFHEYEGVHNICTINKNAGIAPVKVDPEILDLLEFCQKWYLEMEGQTNVTLGPVLSIWHDYMAAYAGGSPDAKLPPLDDLKAAAQHTDLQKMIINREASTVFLEEEEMALDVGAVAKGYAAQLVADKIEAMGFQSFIISAGGNVVAKGPPMDGIRDKWGIGIQDPAQDANNPNSGNVDVVFVTNESVVTSGDYQRFYMVGDQRVHHIIDPDTLMPANYYRGLTVIHEDSGFADLLSTALFCMDYESSRAFADAHNLKVLWVFADGRVEVTDNLLPQLRDLGGATAAIKKDQK